MWEIEYHNDTGDNDESFNQWWTITDDKKYFECKDYNDAKWLQNLLQNTTDNTERATLKQSPVS